MSSDHEPDRTDPLDGLERTRTAMAEACARAGRSPDSVTLVAASKTVPQDVLGRAIGRGLHVYGENRVQEAQAKWPALRAEHPGVELHLIGPLQTNKARDAVALFDVIHSVDRFSLSEALFRQSEKQGRRPKVFVQVNTGLERQKAGVAPSDTDYFLDICRGKHELDVIGLMCIPPVDEPSEAHFLQLREIAERNGLPSLSMGMSGDFTSAIAHGATHVRVGSAVFGARAYPAA
ncbi:YggS family pyridoxal phosphate-dependent enzyme [Streptomyces sp. DT24]|uniref:YggS family pyridoxal phosphate-dependent enzyme n=1 Tax=unclassified Streptomyces TaxID=2593676 RepID=UPI0023B932B5|nr:YggS family pyridoxal phosphate-dependent enzyme [Streptomyces sp. AM 4-1-1]WEH33225.1 YggS family pyridoxal phosphate-dependent enzyme [Streptomyces sp. AM 4-1-1]